MNGINCVSSSQVLHEAFVLVLLKLVNSFPTGKHLQLNTEQNLGSRLCARLNVTGPLTIHEDYIIHEAAAVQRGLSIKDAFFYTCRRQENL